MQSLKNWSLQAKLAAAIWLAFGGTIAIWLYVQKGSSLEQPMAQSDRASLTTVTSLPAAGLSRKAPFDPSA